ncbi:MAG TPA: carbon-nitrogen hydrolase family protein [Burkholderiaceae bacterium]|nr:carbon-nitrogen hydrolase family protein [Burkholderiaceae bacterium]
MKIAALQMVSTPRVGDNLQRARELAAQAASAGAEMLVLPEYFCLMGLHDRDKLAHAEVEGTGPIQQTLAGIAREHRVWLVGGTLPLRMAGVEDRAYNATLVVGPDGRQVVRYDKIHLFRFDDGERRYDEAATLRPGAEVRTFDARARDGGAWRVGLSICYDLRFPELYRAMMQPPCDLIAVPSAFTHATGSAHWELLLRARAVENQCYVVASAQGGRHENGRRTYGHSMVIDPWGEVLAVQADGDGVVLAELRRERLQQVRTQLPALAHRVL